MTDEIEQSAIATVNSDFGGAQLGIVPTPEELEEYIEKLESETMSDDEKQLSLQAQADLAEGTRLAREQQHAKIAALLRTFKGIHNRSQITTLATIGLRRFQRIQEAELERQRDAS